MKKKFSYLVIILFVMLISCNNSSTTYDISGQIKGKKGCDSVYLYGFEPNYNKLMLLNKQKVVSSKFKLSGIVNNVQIAFVKFKGDTVPYYFVLDTNPLSLKISKYGYIIKGSEENNQYYRYLLRRQNVLNEKKTIWNKYQAMASDSTLTDSIELELKTRNDILIDSLEKMTQHYIDRKIVSSQLIENKFGNYITISE